MRVANREAGRHRSAAQLLRALVLLALLPWTALAATPRVITLGDVSQTPQLAARLVYPNLPPLGGIRDVTAYGVLIDTDFGPYAEHSLAFVVPFVGMPRLIDLGQRLPGQAIALYLDDEGFLFVETQVKYGCSYRIAAFDPDDNLLWIHSYDDAKKCLGGESWGIAPSLYRRGRDIGVLSMVRGATGEFAKKLKKRSEVNLRLKDKRHDVWEPMPRGHAHDVRADVAYIEVPHLHKGAGVATMRNEQNKAVGRVRVLASSLPLALGRPTRLNALWRDPSGRLYGEFLAQAGAPQTRVMVLYSPTGVPLGTFAAAAEDDFSFRGTWSQASPFSAAGEWYFTRSALGGVLEDICRLATAP